MKKKIKFKVTERCNGSCTCCQQRLQRYTSFDNRKDMSQDLAYKIIDQAVEAGFSELILSGGEPTLNGDIFKIIKHASERHMTVSLYTNGSLLTENYIDRLLKCGLDIIMVSFYSLNSKNYTTIRQTKDLFSYSIKGLNNLAKYKKSGAKLEIRLQSIISKENYRDLPELYAFAIDSRFDTFSLSYLEHATSDLALYLGEIEIMDLCEKILPRLLCISESRILNTQKKQHNALVINKVAKDYSNNIALYSNGIYHKDSFSCKNDRSYMVIASNGLVLPCCGTEYYLSSTFVGNTNEESIQEIIKGDEYLNFWMERRELCQYCAVDKHFFLFS